MEIETKRLILRPLQLADATEFFRTVGDNAVMKYWHPGADKSIQATIQRIAQIQEHWRIHHFGDWGIIDKHNKQLIGFSGLHYIEDMPEVNIGYALERSKWGQGLGFEVCQTVLEFGLNQLQLFPIVAVISPQNQASIHLMKKCSLVFWKNYTWSGQERVVYKTLD